MTDDPETALTLQQVADRLQLSYSTVFAMRKKIGFRLPGSRLWRVWPARLAELTETRDNPHRLSLRVGKEDKCQSEKIKSPASTMSTSARQAVKEFAALLKQRTAGKRRNTTTS
ncbi:hypothetical protein KDX14_12870 [Burkholderia cenocepacia]|uniref:hypothetical protein n=1 Tax=Burkholderia cenocepacia TaxID=95486 RepID=UPI001B93E32B|nr:hypothetical protein [Burkholderia cenocepacia]